MPSKQEALQAIIDIVKNHQLSIQEVIAALTDTENITKQKTTGILSRIFGYVGSILVFAGICIFIGMQWEQLASIERIAAILGTGFIIFLVAVAAIDNPKYERAATPLLLIAALFQPTGIFVMLDELSHGSDPLYGVLFVSLIMLIQQGFIFLQKKKTALAFTTIFFESIFFITALELLEVDGNAIYFMIGLSLMLISWALGHSIHQAISSFWYFWGSLSLLITSFDFLKNQTYEVLFLGLAAILIYVSITAQNRTLLLVSTLAMLSYISHYTYTHFNDVLGWPIVLIICGVAFIGIGAIAMKINTKFMNAPAELTKA
ncbi:MAG: DUF2157 domain-containing protein [Nitrosomonas sp.]|nr:DUF2157 domain-containing protein [Nitrosomonas sp.]MBK7364541.1 DUF2157 domain-containing protein [Nitrosomonas sp.]